MAQATTATPYRNQLHLSAVLAGSGTPFRNSVKPRCLPQPYVPTKILSTRREKTPGAATATPADYALSTPLGANRATFLATPAWTTTSTTRSTFF